MPQLIDRSPKGDHHYFVSSFDAWTTGEDLFMTVWRHWTHTKAHAATIWSVPVHEKTDYDIEWYQPQVDGASYIDVVYKKQSARDAAKKATA